MHRTVAVLVILGAAAPSFAQEAGTAQFAQPTSSSCPNCLSMPSPTIVLDASAGNIMQPLPDGQRSFASSADLATFLQQNLNAIPVYDGAGNVIGAYGNVLKIGTTYYLDANNNVQPATEPISAFIGGLGAQFTVAGVAYSTGVQGQDVAGPQATASAPSDVFQCNQFGECISGHSWNTHTFGHFYNNVGDRGRSGDRRIPGEPFLLLEGPLSVLHSLDLHEQLRHQSTSPRRRAVESGRFLGRAFQPDFFERHSYRIQRLVDLLYR